MDSASTSKKHWRSVKSLEEAIHLVESSALLPWKDAKVVKKALDHHDQCELIKAFVSELDKKHEDRLGSEIAIESLLVLLSHGLDERLVATLFDTLLDKCHIETMKVFVEIALTSEVTESSHDSQIFAAAVALISEFGVYLSNRHSNEPTELPETPRLLDHITTYLLSVSNNNSNWIRLSLLHFFGTTCARQGDNTPFNRIMSRFGHTVMDHLFALLFYKKTEGVALQFIIENLPYVLDADSHAQKILHQTFKYYMLKKPERFALFVQAFVDTLLAQKGSSQVRQQVFLQHLGALFAIVSEVNHRQLARDLALAIQKFHANPYQEHLVAQVLEGKHIRPLFKQLLTSAAHAPEEGYNIEAIAQFRSSKRGRKPSFSRVEPMGTLGQVAFLGNAELLRPA